MPGSCRRAPTEDQLYRRPADADQDVVEENAS
jgi:hypothetical protein